MLFQVNFERRAHDIENSPLAAHGAGYDVTKAFAIESKKLLLPLTVNSPVISAAQCFMTTSMADFATSSDRMVRLSDSRDGFSHPHGAGCESLQEGTQPNDFKVNVKLGCQIEPESCVRQSITLKLLDASSVLR